MIVIVALRELLLLVLSVTETLTSCLSLSDTSFSVGDMVSCYVYDVDEVKGKVQLSMIPLADLEKRDAAYRNRKSAKGKKNNNKPKKPEKKQVTMDDAMANLLARFGK